MTEYNIRLNPNCAAAVHTGLKFKAGDKGITFRIAVDELDTTGTTAKIVFLRANGTSVESDISGTDGVYIYKTLGNEFAVPGKTVADVKFYAADARVSTASFVFEVSGDTMDGLGTGTGGYSDRLEQLTAEAETAGKDLKETEEEMATVLQNFKEQYGEVGALNPRGNWNSGATYQIRDLVYYNSISWICLAPNTGVAPTDANIAYWMRSTDLVSILNGTTPVGKASDADTIDGLHAISLMKTETAGRGDIMGFDDTNELYITIDGTKYQIPFGMGRYNVRADTVGGLHADVISRHRNNMTLEMIKECGVTPYTGMIGNSVATTIGLPTGTYRIHYIPDQGAGYGTQIAYGGTSLVAYHRLAMNNAWTGWKKLANADEVIHLDGSVPMSGDLKVNANKLIGRHLEGYSSDGVNNLYLNYYSQNAEIYAYSGGTGGKLLHTGNSAKVAIKPTAPSDTTALWYDTVNKVCKRYVDGAWQA